MLKDSIELHRQGRFAEAEQGYRAWLEDQPNDANAMHLLGLLKHQRGETTEALQILEKAHAIAPEDPRIDLAMASMHLQLGHQEDARRGFERALAFDPNLGGAHIGLGQIAMVRGDRASAEQHFRIALRAGEDGHALAGVGAISLERGEHEVALRYLTRASEMVPESALIQFLLGQAFTRRDMLAFAERAFENALRLEPGMHQVRPWLAEVLLKDGRTHEAEPHYRYLSEMPGYEVIAHNGFADVARMQNRLEDAIAEYRTSLNLQPVQALPTRMLAWSLASLGRNAEVVAAYDHYLAHAPEDNEIRNVRADVLMLVDRLPEAAADWNYLLVRDPGNRHARRELALIEERLRHFDAAQANADIALRSQPTDAEMLLIHARTQLRAGDDTGARATLEQLGRGELSEGQNRLCWNYQGRVCDRAGEMAEAVRCFTEAHRGTPAMLPPLDDPRPELIVALREPLDEPWVDAPVLLLGLPGSGVERIAALLADQPQLDVLRDRIGAVMRNDDFNDPRFGFYCGPLEASDIDALRERYLAPIRAAGAGNGKTVVDWLPRWDANLVALVRRAMPGTRLIIVERDPRDTLLNWLAFGWAQNFACPEPVVAAEWLARARRHLHFGAELDEPRRIVVAADPMLENPAQAGGELARFLGLPALPAGPTFASTLYGLGDLPVRFPAGHWHGYRDVLAEAFGHFDHG